MLRTKFSENWSSQIGISRSVIKNRFPKNHKVLRYNWDWKKLQIPLKPIHFPDIGKFMKMIVCVRYEFVSWYVPNKIINSWWKHFEFTHYKQWRMWKLFYCDDCDSHINQKESCVLFVLIFISVSCLSCRYVLKRKGTHSSGDNTNPSRCRQANDPKARKWSDVWDSMLIISLVISF